MADFAVDWHEFNVAVLGAAAALAGLLIVAASVNINVIVKTRSLTARLAAGIAGLVLAMTGAALALIPDIAPLAYGITLLVAAVGAGVFAVQAARALAADPDPANPRHPAKAIVAFVAPIVYAVGAVMLVFGHPAGMIWAAAGAITAMIVAILISWVALVEVLR